MTFGLGFGFPRGQSSGAAPTISYNFVGADALPASLTFTRASNATMFDSQGRLVWAPHNLFRSTQNITLNQWTAIGSVAPILTYGEADPFGGNTATLVDLTPATDCRVAQTALTLASVPDNSDVIVSFWLRRAPGETLTTHVAQYRKKDSTTTVVILSVSDAWQRVSFTFNAGAGAAPVLIWINIQNGPTIQKYIVYGPQLNLGNILLPFNQNISAVSEYFGPRFDYNPVTLAAQGLLIEEARANSIRNSAAVGGTPGAPGTPPTNWGVSSITGITVITSFGVEDGIPYVDVAYSGTNTSGADAYPTVSFDGPSVAAAANGQTWTQSVYARKVAGSDSEAFWNTNVVGRDASQVLISSQGASVALASGSRLVDSRIAVTLTFTDPLVAFAQARFQRGVLANGAAVDITIRLGGPQLEQGAFATSLIPTFGTAATRTAETCTSNISGVVANGVGTLTASYICRAVAAATFQTAVSLSQTSNDRVTIYEFGSVVTGEVSAAGVANASPTVTAPGAFAQRRTALGYATSSANFAVNGALGTLATTAVPPTGLVYLNYGATSINPAAGQIWMQKTAYYPTRFTDVQLQALTA